jgi:hypothetical protein
LGRKSIKKADTKTDRRLITVSENDETFIIAVPGETSGKEIAALVEKQTGLIRDYKTGNNTYMDFSFKPTFKRPLTSLDCQKDWC